MEAHVLRLVVLWLLGAPRGIAAGWGGGQTVAWVECGPPGYFSLPFLIRFYLRFFVTGAVGFIGLGVA
ncbi:hypothetical protein BDR22DRAFT_854912 [Usnea florida]